MPINNVPACLRVLLAVILAVSIVATLAVPTLAQQDGEEDDDEEDDDDDTVININLDELINKVEKLIDEFTDFADEWDTKLEQVLIGVLFAPFRTLAQQLVKSIALVLTNTPSVYPNPAVEEIHRQVLVVSYMLSGIAFAGAGILYMAGPVLGVSYVQARMILPRLVVALIFGSVSLPLLQLAVDLSDALVVAFTPDGLTMSFRQMAGLSASLVIVWVINAILLLGLVLLFIIRAVYLLFVAAISPLIALTWAFPKVKRYADTFIAGWFTALAMAPLDMLVLRFVLALLEGQGSTGLQSLSNWVLGMAGFALLLWIPFQLYGASQSVVGQAYTLSKGVKRRYRQSQSTGIKKHDTEALKQEIRRRRERRTNRGSNDFDLPFRGDD